MTKNSVKCLSSESVQRHPLQTTQQQVLKVASKTERHTYTYGRVFNECTVTYLPRLSTSKQGPVKLGAIPVDPHFPDADPPQYPMDAIYTLKPDPRSVVTMTYTLTTIYKVGNQSFTHSIDINQSVTQNPELYLGQKMEALAQTTYYYHGLQHEGCIHGIQNQTMMVMVS